MISDSSNPGDAQVRLAAHDYRTQFAANPDQTFRLRQQLVQAAGYVDRLARARTLLAVLCGEQTAARALSAAATRHGIELRSTMSDVQWHQLLNDLIGVVTELCGRHAAALLKDAAR